MNADLLVKKLEDYGADMEGVAERFSGDMDFYATCLGMFFDQPDIAELGAAVTAGDVQAGFAVAHSIKGTSANLGLTPLYSVVCVLVEDLRRGDGSKMAEQYADVVAQYEILKKVIDRD